MAAAVMTALAAASMDIAVKPWRWYKAAVIRLTTVVVMAVVMVVVAAAAVMVVVAVVSK